MMRSFKALDSSYDKGIVGEREVRLARGVARGCSQPGIDWVGEGSDVGIITETNRRGQRYQQDRRTNIRQRCTQPEGDDEKENVAHCCRFFTFCESH